MGLDQYWYVDKPSSDDDREDNVIYWRKCWEFHSVLEKYTGHDKPEYWNTEYIAFTRADLTNLLPVALSYVDKENYHAIAEIAACVSNISDMLLCNPDKDTFYYYAWW